MFNIFTFRNVIWFWELKIPFCENLMPSKWGKLPDFNAISVNLHWREDSKFFPLAESWLVSSNFPRISRMQGMAYMLIYQFQRTRFVTLWTDNTFHLTLNVTSADYNKTGQSPATVLFITTLIQTITLDEVLVLLGLKRLQSLKLWPKGLPSIRRLKTCNSFWPGLAFTSVVIKLQASRREFSTVWPPNPIQRKLSDVYSVVVKATP